MRKAPEQFERLCTLEDTLLPSNTLAELRRDVARLRFVGDQIREIEAMRLERPEQQPEKGVHAMVRLQARVYGI